MNRRLLAWWFIAYSTVASSYGAHVLGPFRTQPECEQVRVSVATHGKDVVTTWCWWDGKP